MKEYFESVLNTDNKLIGYYENHELREKVTTPFYEIYEVLK